MGFLRDSPNDFVQHEIKTFQRKGDQIRSEYERLNPDGSVTKTVAFGDCKEGLKYRTFNMGVDGVVREIPAEQAAPAPRPVAQQPQPQYQQVQQPQPQQQYQQVQQSKPQQQPLRRVYTFHLEPKSKETQESGTWRLRPLGVQEQETEKQREQKVTPWWYSSLKDTVEVKDEKPREKPEPVENKSFRRFFDFFGDDLTCYHLKPKIPLARPRLTDPFDVMEGSFDRPLLGGLFSSPLLEDF